MKITTLEYSANQPVNRQITVPTNSKYAVGIKVYKDGVAVDCGLDEISVGGISATEQIAGYNVFELSADGIASINTRDVAILKYPSLNYDARGTATYTGSPIIPGIGYRPIIDLVYLSATPLSGMTEIKAADIAECETSAILSTASGTTEYNLFPVFCLTIS